MTAQIGDVRTRILKQRKELPSGQASELSTQVIDRFLQETALPWNGLRVGLYRSLPGELDLRPLEIRLRASGAQLGFPRVLDLQSGAMEFAEGGSGVWPRGRLGFEEPPLAAEAFDPALLDVIFVPGVAFGAQGERVGMGAGFYDRYLLRAPKALRIALAFDFQLLPKLQQESWDQRVEWIWTEKRQIQLRTWSPS